MGQTIRWSFRRGFTIIELLVVVAIIIILCSLMIPALASLREAAYASQCTNHMRQWGQALHVYIAERGQHLPREGQIANPQMEDAWYNELPPLVGERPYGEVYGDDPDDPDKEKSYEIDWIGYCPTKLRYEEKNSSSGKNSFHYGMNAVLNGTNTYDPNYGLKSAGDQKFTRLARIFDPASTVFLAEGNNQPLVTPQVRDYYPPLDRQRHSGNSLNLLFIDAHVKRYQGSEVEDPSQEKPPGGRPYWAQQRPRIIWGPFKN